LFYRTDGREKGAAVESDPASLLPEIEPLQLLDPDGRLGERSDVELDLDDTSLLSMYRHMVVTRRLDREFINLQRQGQLGVYPPCLGQEAAQVGSAFALDDDDWIFPQYRELGCAVVRGLPPEQLAHLWRGTWLADHDAYEHRFAYLSIPIGTHPLHAVGFGMGARLDQNPIVVATYFGDGATSGGDVHEALNFAGVFRTPVVFFVQNNRWAISVPLEEQTAAPTLAHKGVGYGIPSTRCDGNDVLASYVTMRSAVQRARDGGGPTLIEAMTYRMEAHTTSDDPTRYRTSDELDHWARYDPITRFRRFLTDQGMLDDAGTAAADDAGETAATRLREAVYDAPAGPPEEVFEHVYVDPGSAFDRQRALLAAELRARGDDVGTAP
jgi:2-oxoisovalerate dehydrogenase E1 component alpha subunit